MFNKVMVALHGSESPQTVGKIAAVARLMQVPVTVLHVLETGLAHYGHIDTLASSVTKGQFISYINELAEEQKERAFLLSKEIMEPPGLEVKYKSAGGRPGPEIVREVKSGNYDLVMIGRKEYSGPGNTSSKTAEFLLKELSCPLFRF